MLTKLISGYVSNSQVMVSNSCYNSEDIEQMIQDTISKLCNIRDSFHYYTSTTSRKYLMNFSLWYKQSQVGYVFLSDSVTSIMPIPIILLISVFCIYLVYNISQHGKEVDDCMSFILCWISSMKTNK